MSGLYEKNPCFFFRIFFTIVLTKAVRREKTAMEGKMKLKNLRVNNIEHPLGFQIMPLSFSWTVEEAGEAKEQQSARIRIYENVETEADMEGKRQYMTAVK